MIIICYGMPKSASTFTFQLASALVDCKYSQSKVYKSLPEKTKRHFYKNTRFIEKLDQAIYDLVDIVPSDKVLVIKTHSPLSKPVESVLESGNALAIVNYRNPYDIIVSLKDVGEKERLKKKSERHKGFAKIKSIDDAKVLIPDFIRKAKTWLDKKSESLLYVSYQEVEKIPFNVARDINEFLQLNLEPNSIDTIVDGFISDKSKIGQYNIGVSGRGAEISFSESDKKLVEEINSFVDLYFQGGDNTIKKEIAPTIRKNIDDYEYYFQIAEEFYKQREFNSALTTYQKVIEINPKHSWSYYKLGNIFREQNKDDQAVTAYRKTIEINPDFSWSYYHLATILEKQGKLEEAIASYQKAIELYPNFSPYRYKLEKFLQHRIFK
ncbi:tetratricopeptide repeat protein [Okeania hirsuta]|nr:MULTISPECIES: tetratricopeptide repeat protein [Okeania]NES89355.1 tetratricopeptide repeat protein [Okeania sp. SIO2B9]